MELENGSAMSRVRSMQRVDKANVVDMTSDIGKQLADLVTTRSVWLELPRRPKQIPSFGKSDLGLGKGKRLAVVAVQQWLALEGVHLRWASFHKEENNSFCPLTIQRFASGDRGFCQCCLSENRRKRKTPEPESPIAKAFAT